MIGIIGAMHEEVIELKKLMLQREDIEKAGMIFYKGNLEGNAVVLVECGIGKVNSAICTTILIETFKVEKIIFTGVAGGVNPDLDISDVVISTDLIQHDFDVIAFGLKAGQIPRMDEYIFKADKKLVDLAYTSAKKVLTNKIIKGRILSGDQFISSKEKIAWLRDTFKGDCAEMEGASVAHVSYLYKTPFVVLRALSDKADHSANMDFQEFVHIAAENSKKIVIEMLKNI